MTSTAATAGTKLTASFLNGLRTGQLITPSSATTVNSTATETYFAVAQIPANDMAVGMAYRIKAYGTYGVTGTPTINIRNRIGTSATAASNTSIGQTGAQTTQSGVTSRLWIAEWFVAVESTGATGAVSGPLHVKMSGILAGTAPFINDTAELTTVIDGVSSATVDTTSLNYFGLSVTWGTSSSSNTLTCKGFTAERLI
jgi:hypothetical protein